MLAAIVDWFWQSMYRLGLWKKDAVMLLLGLDNAGKTTLLNKLATGRVGRFPPTERPVVKEMEVGNVRIKAWDLGGHRVVRDMWQDYYTLCDAIVFLVDVSDKSRLDEASESLWELITAKDDTPLQECVLMVLGNKIDIVDAVSEAQLHEVLQYSELAKHFKSVGSFQVSLITGAGYANAFKWLEEQL